MLSGRFLLTVPIHSHTQNSYVWHEKKYQLYIISTSIDISLFDLSHK
jgi:hypothetical protein